MSLPEAEALLQRLAQDLSPFVTANTALVGIHTGGAWVAEELHKRMKFSFPLGVLDISFYRDDFSRIGLHPQIKPSTIPFDVEGRDIILVDDVLYTGRTVRAAMNELFDYGRPASITLAVLVDRGGRELPVAAAVAAHTVALEANKNIELSRDEGGKLKLGVK